MTTSSVDKQMPPLDAVYRIYVYDKNTGKQGYHNRSSTYSFEKEISKATVYNSYRSAKQVYGYHYRSPSDRYDVQILSYTLTPLSIENLPRTDSSCLGPT